MGESRLRRLKGEGRKSPKGSVGSPRIPAGRPGAQSNWNGIWDWPSVTPFPTPLFRTMQPLTRETRKYFKPPKISPMTPLPPDHPAGVTQVSKTDP